MHRAVVSFYQGFYQDGEGHWAARLEFGHWQYVRHDPPWTAREWVMSEEGKRAYWEFDGMRAGAMKGRSRGS
jgi:Protein of unknown function (DUF3565)